MAKSNDKAFSLLEVLKSGASLAVIGAVSTAMLSTAALAQDDASDEDDSDDTIVVTGVRESLKNAQEIKRDASTFVDSITEADIGAFPDKSVAEALQRVAGITVNRFAAPDDTVHFSTEPSGVIVRGLQQVRSEFNGRDTFSANSSRGLSWGDVSPELMGGVDTYKNQMASLIEGGIAGTVNLRTRVPFDQKGELIALTGSLNYGDRSQEITPEFSGLYSNRWETEIGEFGFLGNFAYSDVATQSDGIQLFRMNRFRIPDGQSVDSWDAGSGLYYIPDQVRYLTNDYERERTGFALAGQWQDVEGKWLATAQMNHSNYKNAWRERIIGMTYGDLSFGQSVFFEVDPGNVRFAQPSPGTDNFSFDNSGLFEKGWLTDDIGWWGDTANSVNHSDNNAGQPLVEPCYGWNGCEPARRPPAFDTVTRSNNNENTTRDISLNVKYSPNDNWRFNFDLQTVHSEVTNYDIEARFRANSDVFIDLTGEYPVQILEAENSLNVNNVAGGLANPTNYRIQNLMDHVEDSEGDEIAIRGDVEYIFTESRWLDSLQVGARYADRDQNVRWSTYNWQNVANEWTENAQYYNLTDHDPCSPGEAGCNGQAFTGYPTGYYEVSHFDSGINPGLVSNDSNNQYVFFNFDLLNDQKRMREAFTASALGFSNGVGWDAICTNEGDRADEIPGTCFTPAETIDLSEETMAFYAQLNFGGDSAELWGRPFSGNIGVRYIETTNVSSGGIAFPLFNTEELLNCEDRDTADIPEEELNDPLFIPRTTACYLTADQYAFNDGTDQTSVVEVDHTHWLPSFNFKYELTDEVLLRFAASRALSRPDIGNLRNYLGIGADLPSTDTPDDPRWLRDANGDVIGVDVFYNGGAQNPRLTPVTAEQFDVGVEWYFAEVGSLTFTAFYKEFSDYIQFGTLYEEYTNNGVTNEVEVRRPLNGEGASIQGFEVAYQQFYDFLPEPFDGLGVQANYTFIDNQGIEVPGVRSTGADGGTITGQAPDQITVDKLEGLSDHSFNLIGMYEKGPFALRMAYNWRSEYLVTAIDCCVAVPIWNKATGYLDGSIRYALGDTMEISLQGSNLLNTETVLEQQVTNIEDGGLRMPNAWFQNDRRFTLGVRLKYN